MTEPPTQGPPAPEDTAADPAAAGAVAVVKSRLVLAEPFDRLEVMRTLWLPHRLLELVLAERARLVANIARNENLVRLVLVMLLGSALFAVPYGLVLGPERFWHVAALFVGSMAICFPSLQVFSAYLGVNINLFQNLALALVITSSAALFCFGFFPIFWFLKSTMATDADVTARHISTGLLAVSLIAGISQLNRCVFMDKALRQISSSPVLLTLWQALLVFITYRMAVVLGLL